MKVKNIHILSNDESLAISEYCNGVIYELENGDYYYGCSSDVVQHLSKVEYKNVSKLEELLND